MSHDVCETLENVPHRLSRSVGKKKTIDLRWEKYQNVEAEAWNPVKEGSLMFDVRDHVMLIMLIIRTSHCQQNFINVNVNSSCYFTATYFDHISVIMFTRLAWGWRNIVEICCHEKTRRIKIKINGTRRRSWLRHFVEAGHLRVRLPMESLEFSWT
jgi:hypothetical protein